MNNFKGTGLVCDVLVLGQQLLDVAMIRITLRLVFAENLLDCVACSFYVEDPSLDGPDADYLP